MPEENLPPQRHSIALYAAGGGFAGVLVALLLAWLLGMDCCCEPGPRAAAEDSQARSVARAVLPAGG